MAAAANPADDLFCRLIDFRQWVDAGHCLIQNRDSFDVEPLTFNWVQDALWRECLRQAATCPRCEREVRGPDATCRACTERHGRPVVRGIPVRLIVPKSRKMGVSTFCESLAYYMTAYHPNVAAVTYAHTDQDTAAIFGLARLIHSCEHPFDDLAAQATTGFTFAHNSSYACRTAGGKGVSRGSTIHIQHISELAALQSKSGLDLRAIMALLNAVPKRAGTIVIIESTGEGPTGLFYSMCRLASETPTKSQFRLMFFPWFRDPGYTRYAPPDWEPNDEERGMMELYGLTREQVCWYHHEFINACGDGADLAKVSLWRQQFPTTLEDCFGVAAGRVLPHFSRLVHACAPLEIQPHWKRYRAIDWGASYEHPFVCLWVAHDETAAPGLRIAPDLNDVVRELTAWRYNDRTGQPIKQDDHVPDALRILCVTADLTGLVYVYRCLYDRNPPPPEELARRIHQMSAWTQGEGEPDANLRLFRPGKSGETYEMTVADRSRKDSIAQFTAWGIPTIGHTRPKMQHTIRGEVADGIFHLSALVSGSASFRPTMKSQKQSILESAVSGLSGAGTATGRRLALTEEEEQAIKRLSRRRTPML